jgi:cytochrome c553
MRAIATTRWWRIGGADLRLALAGLALAVMCGVAAGARERIAPATGSLDAKLLYCKTCHGLEAQGYRGYLPMPRLAGQQPQYIENQLRAFIERRRTNPIMANVAHVLTPSMVSGLAAHLKNLDPSPIGGAPRHGLGMGKEIFENGLPESNVPACSACHGAEAKGQNEIPRLAGQLYEYTVAQLSGWSKVRGQGTAVDTSAIMAPTAHNLTHSQIEAVAAYVSTLR